MTENDFLNYIEQHILEYLPKDYAGANISIRNIQKGNGLELSGLQVKRLNENIVPIIYMNAYYGEYLGGESMETILQRIATENLEARKNISNIDAVPMSFDFENLKGRLFVRAWDTEANRRYLKGKPHMEQGAFSSTYHLLVSEGDENEQTIAVTNEIMGHWGIGVQQLHEAAMENMQKILPPALWSLEELTESLFHKDGVLSSNLMDKERINMETSFLPVYVLTSVSQSYGAGYMFDHGLLEEISKKMGEGYYVLPSSVHEVLLVPRRDSMPVEQLKDMVYTVNRSQVSPEERLSDQVQYYDPIQKKLACVDESPQAGNKITEAPKNTERVPNI